MSPEHEISITRTLMTIAQNVAAILRDQESLKAQIAALQLELDTIKTIVLAIQTDVETPLPAAFQVTYSATQTPQTFSTGESQMAKSRATASVDYLLGDNGTMVATLMPDDAAGLPTTWPAGAPIVCTVANAAGTGTTAIVGTQSGTNPLVFSLAPASPPVLGIGYVPTFTGTITNPDGSTTTVVGVGGPIDVAAGGPAGFQVVESAS